MEKRCDACLPLVFDTIHGHELPYSVIICSRKPFESLNEGTSFDSEGKGLSIIQVSGDSKDMEQEKANTSKGRFQVIYISPE